MDYKEIFAKNLKLLIGDKSINSIAKAIGIPQQTLYRYVNAQREAGLNNLIKIAKYFGESLDSLIGFDYL